MTNANLLTANMTAEQRTIFLAQLAASEKDEVAGVLLALLLGTFGAHHFYLRRTGLGIVYLLFFWTGFTAIAGLIECFLMPGRVRRYNLEQATFLASLISGSAGVAAGIPAAFPVQRCAGCGEPLPPGVRFCAKCGTAVHQAPASLPVASTSSL